MTLEKIRLWVALILLLDATVGVLWLDKWQKLFPLINIRRMIVIECAAITAILVIHLWLRP